MKESLGKTTLETPVIEGKSVWVENGEWFCNDTVDPEKFGPHQYHDNYSLRNPRPGLGKCVCGCEMCGFSSSGPVDPFGACPSNPKQN